MPMAAAPISADGVMGKATINAAGYAPDSFSWPILLGLIAIGFLPSVMIIVRSSHRRRAGPMEPMS